MEGQSQRNSISNSWFSSISDGFLKVNPRFKALIESNTWGDGRPIPKYERQQWYVMDFKMSTVTQVRVTNMYGVPPIVLSQKWSG